MGGCCILWDYYYYYYISHGGSVMIGFLEEIVMTSLACKRKLFGSSSSPRGRASGMAMVFCHGKESIVVVVSRA